MESFSTRVIMQLPPAITRKTQKWMNEDKLANIKKKKHNMVWLVFKYKKTSLRQMIEYERQSLMDIL